MKPQTAQPNTVDQCLSPLWTASREPRLLPPICLGHAANSGVASFLDLQLGQMGLVLQELDAQTRCMEQIERELSDTVAQILTSCSIPRVMQSHPALQEHYDFVFQLVGFPTLPLYVKRGFDLSFKVVSTSTTEVVEWPLCCLLSVRRMDAGGVEITKARSGRPHVGKPFLRGNLTRIFSQGPIMTFTYLAFADISSLYPHGRVNLLVHCVNNQRCKPLLIEGVRIKARKKHPDEVI